LEHVLLEVKFTASDTLHSQLSDIWQGGESQLIDDKQGRDSPIVKHYS
jgi:hypothetical protein